ncbi:DUF523 and DUF1722 domain-containing protein [Actinocorallia sp. API 0066]|nr:DUF523 and DUF1722 domain-containing protein [Actinocorallia sp. API 0066]
MRYNGGHARARFLTEVLGPLVDWVTVCPEVEAGLGVPRPTVRLRTDGHLVSRDGESDHTEAARDAIGRAMPEFVDLDGFVVKSRSPSCALYGVPRYASGLPGERTDGQPVDRKGRGLFTAALLETYPDLPVEEEGRLNDPLLREHFVERVFARARLRALFGAGWRPRDLVAFHSRHKLQILAHDPAGYRSAGRIVALAGAEPPETLVARYARVFAASLAVRPARGRQVNALHHVLGPLSRRIGPVRRAGIVTAIEAFQAGQAPLSVPVALLRHDAEAEGLTYLTEQTFLDPFPTALPLRHHL